MNNPVITSVANYYGTWQVGIDWGNAVYYYTVDSKHTADQFQAYAKKAGVMVAFNRYLKGLPFEKVAKKQEEDLDYSSNLGDEPLRRKKKMNKAQKIIQQCEALSPKADNPQVKAAITEIANQFRDELARGFKQSVTRALDACRQLDDTFKNEYPSGTSGDYKNKLYTYKLISPYLRFRGASGRPGEPKILIPDFESRLNKDAEQYAEDVMAEFVSKMTKKLDQIIVAKGDFKSIIKSGMISNHRLRFTFEDGSAFTVQNQIVVVWNYGSAPFNRFPTTFHDVIFPDGTKMATPSEAKMKSDFIGKGK